MSDHSPEEAPENKESSGGEIRAGVLVGRSLPAAILIVGLPVLLQQLLGAAVGLIDKMLAGGLQDAVVVDAMDGLGVGSYVGWFIGIAMAGLGIGGQAIIARAIGRGDVDEAERALGQAMAMSLAWGALVGCLAWVLAPFMAALCGLDGPAATYLVDYVRTLAWGMPACGLMMVGAMCLVGAGETVQPAIIAVVMNLINAASSWLLSGATLSMGASAFRSPLGLDWEVGGIAAGTSLGYLVGGLLTLVVLFRGVRDLQLRLRHLVPLKSMISRVVRVGVPNFLEGISMWSANLGVLTIIGYIATRNMGSIFANTASDVHMADPVVGAGLAGAHIIAVQWESFSFLPGFAIGTAAGALAGQFLGAGNVRMACRAVWLCVGIAVVLMGVVGIGYIFGGDSLTRIISDQPRHLQLVPDLLLICGTTQVFFAVTMVVRQALRGAGDTVWTFLITTVSCYGIRLPAAWIFGVTMEWGLVGVWIGLCGELAVRAVLFTARFLHGGWAQRAI